MTDVEFIAKVRRFRHHEALSVQDLIALARMVIDGDLIHVDEARAMVAQWDAEDRATEAVDAARGVA
jgi:hypothetical protein